MSPVAIVIALVVAAITYFVVTKGLGPIINLARQKAYEARDRLEKGSTIASDDGQVEVTVPLGWSVPAKSLNEKAHLQVANPVVEQYLMVISESKMDFPNMTLKNYASIVNEKSYRKFSDAQESGPVEMQVDGHPALQYVIRGSYRGKTTDLAVVYLQTIVETAGYYHQILAWTLKRVITY